MGVRMDECRRRVGRVGSSATATTVDDAIAEAYRALSAWGAAE